MISLFFDRLSRLHTYKRLYTKIMSPFVSFPKIKNPTLIMTLLVRDEEDVIEQNLKFHKAMGVDSFIVTNNASTDKTGEILEKYKKLGWIKELIYTGDKSYKQSVHVDKMIRIAIEKYHADWIINCDADEFWWTKKKNLKKEIENFDCNICYVPLMNVYPEEGKKIFDCSLFVAGEVNANEYPNLSPYSIYDKMIPKVIHRSKYYQHIHDGNHLVDMRYEKAIVSETIRIHHYQYRSFEHFKHKVETAGKSVQQNPDPQFCYHWRYFYKILQSGEITQEYEKVVGSMYIKSFIQKRLVIDEKEYMEFLKKSITN